MGKEVGYFPSRGLFIYKNPPVITFNMSTIASKAIKHFIIVSVLLFAVRVILQSSKEKMVFIIINNYRLHNSFDPGIYHHMPYPW